MTVSETISGLRGPGGGPAPRTHSICAADVQDEARRWVGTPFRHQGRIRLDQGNPKSANIAGVDCVGVVLCVPEALELLDVFGVPFRGSDYMNYPPRAVTTQIYDECKRRMIAREGDPQVGDVIVFTQGAVPCHAGIATQLREGLGIVHAYEGAKHPGHMGQSGWTIEHAIDAKWRRRMVAAFRLPGVE